MSPVFPVAADGIGEIGLIAIHVQYLCRKDAFDEWCLARSPQSGQIVFNCNSKSVSYTYKPTFGPYYNTNVVPFQRESDTLAVVSWHKWQTVLNTFKPAVFGVVMPLTHLFPLFYDFCVHKSCVVLLSFFLPGWNLLSFSFIDPNMSYFADMPVFPLK